MMEDTIKHPTIAFSRMIITKLFFSIYTLYTLFKFILWLEIQFRHIILFILVAVEEMMKIL